MNRWGLGRGWMVVIAVVGGLLGETVAGAEALVTDRPDQTESAEVVPVGAWQIESGWTYSVDEEDEVEVRSHEAPGTLLRLGLVERWELRFGWQGLARTKADGRGGSVTDEGALDAELGAKVVLHVADAGGPQLALLFGTSVPVGEEGFSSERFDPSFRFNLAHDLRDGWSIGYNLGAEWATEMSGEDRSTLSRWIYTVAAGRGLGERWGVFLEAYGDLGGSQGGPPAHGLDGGLTYLVHPRLQLDVAAGVGLSEAAGDYFVGVGISYRGPF